MRIQQKHEDDPCTVQGIPDDHDKKKRVKVSENFACHSAVLEHPGYGEVIPPQGDQHKTIFLAEAGPA